MRIGITRRWLSNDHATVETVDLLQTGVSVPEMGACVAGPLVAKIIKNCVNIKLNMWQF